jgi:phosphomannomutase
VHTTSKLQGLVNLLGAMSSSIGIPPVNPDRLAAVFKAYDIRGLTPDELDASVAVALGAAFANFAQSQQILIGRDMRTSGEMLASAFSEGVTSQGVDVVDVGLASTDLVYFASGSLNLPAVMLTASHNPASYNGMKFCLAGARAIGADSGLGEIRELASRPASVSPNRGVVERSDQLELFVKHVHSFIDIPSLKKLKVVVDTANGMGGLVVPAVFETLPFDLEVLYQELDGNFPNHPADPLQPENLIDLQRRVRETRADIGLAFDGDADRVFLVDELSNPVNGSLTTALVASAILQREGPGPVLHNLICSRSTAEAISEFGGSPIRTRVGHSYIKAIMAETGAMFGGEHSGHYYFARNFGADSGLIAALIVLEQLSQDERPLSELMAPFDRYASSGEINTAVRDPESALRAVADAYDAHSQDFLDGLTVDCGDWWFNLRPSNTEPLVRLNVECSSEEEVALRVADILSLIT